MIEIDFSSGTLEVRCDNEAAIVQGIPNCKWDVRTNCFRLPAYRYHNLITAFFRLGVEYVDRARDYQELELPTKWDQTPFDYQEEAIEAWVQMRRRGYIALPTGTGKSFVAILAISSAQRSTIIVVPTIDLMHQWYDTLKTYFPDTPVGLIGGGYHEPETLTVTTYDSAYLRLDTLGNKFGLIVFDECHHLPGPTYSLAAEFSLAPYRLGLSATPERMDGGHNLLDRLIGPCAFRKDIREMAGDYLAEYEVIQLQARLSSEESKEYQKNRDIYIDFLRKKQIRMGGQGWNQFIQLSSRSAEGRRAFLAYRRQKDIAQAADVKLKKLEYLIKKHAQQRILIFTHDNLTAYTISRQFLVPVITHQTKSKERRDILLMFNEGTYGVLVTSKVLNEGVNIPAANIGIILSGSASIREHVQRLGRILRKHKEKKAILYEIVTEGTSEEYTSQRRRNHEAYKRE